MKIIDLLQGSDPWKLWRKQGVSASDAAVLLGLSPYKTLWQLWAEKVGVAKERDLSANPVIQHGLEFEGAARVRLQNILRDILIPLCIESTEHNRFLSSLDGITSKGEPTELKCPTESVFKDVVSLKQESEAFKLYFPQVQFQLLVTGASRGYLAFYFDGEIEVFLIQRDEVMLRNLISQGRLFLEMIDKRKEPTKDPARDFYIPEGQEIARWVCLAQEHIALDSKIQMLNSQLEKLKELQKVCRNGMQSMMGSYMHADYCGVAVTRYKVTGKVDWDRLYAEKGSALASEVDNYRKPDSERCRITVTGDLAPRNIVAPSIVEPVKQAVAQAQTAFF